MSIVCVDTETRLVQTYFSIGVNVLQPEEVDSLAEKPQYYYVFKVQK